MKKIVLILIVLTSFWSCQEKGNNTEFVEVTDYIQIKNNLIPSETIRQMGVDVFNIFSEIQNNVKLKSNLFLYDFLIDTNGNVERIEAHKQLEKESNEKLFALMKNWKFGKYSKNGNKLKYKLPITIRSITWLDGKTRATIVGHNGEIVNDKVFFVDVEEMPSLNGGIKSIQENIMYPQIAQTEGIEGRVFVKAYVSSVGKVVKTEIIRGIGAGCDEEAEKAVKKAIFIPAKHRGKPANVQVTVPILFKLDSRNNDEEYSIYITSTKSETEITFNITYLNISGILKTEKTPFELHYNALERGSWLIEQVSKNGLLYVRSEHQGGSAEGTGKKMILIKEDNFERISVF